MACFILKLPEEILLEIVSASSPWPDDPDSSRFFTLYAHRRTLPLVCRRLYALANPLLYARITLGQKLYTNHSQRDGPQETDRSADVKKSIVLLQRSLNKNPSLGLLCTELAIDLAFCCEHETKGPVVDIIKALPNIKALRIHDCRHNLVPTMFLIFSTVLNNMPSLERLAFTASPGHLGILNISFLHPFLRAMTVDRFPDLTEVKIAVSVRDYQRLSDIIKFGVYSYLLPSSTEHNPRVLDY